MPACSSVGTGCRARHRVASTAADRVPAWRLVSQTTQEKGAAERSVIQTIQEKAIRPASLSWMGHQASPLLESPAGAASHSCKWGSS